MPTSSRSRIDLHNSYEQHPIMSEAPQTHSSMAQMEPTIPRTSRRLRVTILLSPHDQSIANQLLPRLTASWMCSSGNHSARRRRTHARRACSLQAQVLQPQAMQFIERVRPVDRKS
ncbi:hypothetical protein QA641_34580 [Bradyrhizobium sp. CB1650]|uniref:hypothetical protein n=1 Tax=Bradyrhizobium sp. CB1650 TaxID=3039153 RepID=UPI002435BEA3|nr:hypothetical protein [Bradyrhizobium sp. CB1650]WGD50675.1 hypothetical protein QA641_34580 [Bradyrhizobium sp. CB1650]